MIAQAIELFKILATFTLFTFFGFLILDFKSLKFNFLNLPIYLTVAIPLLSLGYFFLRFINIRFEIISLSIFLVCMVGFLKTSFASIEVKKTYPFFIAFTIIGIIVISGSSFFEGFTNNKSLLISGPKVHDALWHIALEESINKSIPPVNPIYAPEKIKNYHYLTDIFISFLAQATNIPTINVFLKWSPFILGFLFISTSYLLLFQITKNITISYLGSSLVLFSASLSYLVPLYFKNASTGQSVFWLDQSTRYSANPQLLLSLIIINVIFLLTLKSLKKYWIIIAMLLASLIGIKVYGFIVLLESFFLAGLFYYYKNRDGQFLKITILSLTLAVLIAVSAGVSSGFPFIFKPGWFIGSMYQSADRLNNPEWEIHRQLFLQTTNYKRLTVHWIVGILIFFVGNFGLKIAGLPLAIFHLKKINELKPIFFLSIASLLISLTLPMFFIQKGVVWNTIQFMHYAQVPLVILIIYSIKKLGYKYQLAILLIILVIGLPTTFAEVKKNFQLKLYAVYDKELIDGLSMINKIIPEKDRIIVSSNLYSTSIVPAFGKRSVFYSDQGIIDILRIDSLKRIAYINNVEKGIESCKKGETFIFNNPYTASISAQLIFKNNEVSIVRCATN